MFTVDSVSGPAYPTSITNGRILWYHSLAAQGPQKDAPGQLTEITFRSDYYAPENNAGFQYLIGTDPDTLNANDFNLINYDVSYVDSMVLPVAMQADNVPVEKPVGSGTPTFPFGWAGSSQTIDDTETVIQGMQTAIKNFASSDPSVNGLGTYFADQAHPGGQGYPSYYNPNASVDTKLPSGQNLFLSSPFNDVRSVYDNEQVRADQRRVGSRHDPRRGPGGLRRHGHPHADAGPEARGTEPWGWWSHWAPASRAGRSSHPAPRSRPAHSTPTASSGTNGQIIGVHLSNAIPRATGPQPTYVYNIVTPQADYAATAIMSLWYSWANYYVAYAANDRHATEQMLPGTHRQHQGGHEHAHPDGRGPGDLGAGDGGLRRGHSRRELHHPEDRWQHAHPERARDRHGSPHLLQVHPAGPHRAGRIWRLPRCHSRVEAPPAVHAVRSDGHRFLPGRL